MKKKPVSGIYTIVNKVTGGLYVGKSVNISERWHRHRKDLRRGRKTCNPYLLNAWNKYGESSFEFRIVEERSGPLLELERAYWDFYRDSGHTLYNIRGCGEGAERCAPETRDKIRAALIGRKNGPHTQETRDKIRAAHIGRPKSPDHLSAILVASHARANTPEKIAARELKAQNRRRPYDSAETTARRIAAAAVYQARRREALNV